jgi:hypothetical protein
LASAITEIQTVNSSSWIAGSNTGYCSFNNVLSERTLLALVRAYQQMRLDLGSRRNNHVRLFVQYIDITGNDLYRILSRAFAGAQ